MKKGELAFRFTLLGVSVLFFIASLQITRLSELTLTSDGAYPVLISGLCLIIAGFIVVSGLKNRGRAPEEDKKSVFSPDILVMILFILLYMLAIILIHYILATLLFSVLTISYLEQWRWKSGLLIGFTATFWIVLIFKYGFSVILP